MQGGARPRLELMAVEAEARVHQPLGIFGHHLSKKQLISMFYYS